MKLLASTTLTAIIAFALLFSYPNCYLSSPYTNDDSSIPESDADLIEVALNLEFLEAELYLYAAFGFGLDSFAPNLTGGGPKPIAAQSFETYVDPEIQKIIEQFAWQEIGHLRLIKSKIEGFPRPLLNLSKILFSKTVDKALGVKLNPPFNAYESGLNLFIALSLIPYVGLTGYVGANPHLQSEASRKLVAGLLAVKSGQDAVIRAYLYERKDYKVYPYNITVGEFANKISELVNKLGGEGRKDEGLVVPKGLGAEGKIKGNVTAGDEYSAGYARTPEEIFRIVYRTGDEHRTGGFYPEGASGKIARSYLVKDN